MDEMTAIDMPFVEVERPPTEDELPYEDGIPMETRRHRLQMNLLIETIELAWAGRDDFFVNGNMFIYFSPHQVRDYDFRGPDFFAVLDVPRRDRKSWVVWQEGKGPDVVIELLSDSTAVLDKGAKKQIYQDRLRVPEYFWFHPFTGELAGFTLVKGVYQPILPDEQGRLVSEQLQLALVRWQGTYYETGGEWLRWATIDGELLLTGPEMAEREQKIAERERQRAEEAEQKTAELESLLAQYRDRFGDLSTG